MHRKSITRWSASSVSTPNRHFWLWTSWALALDQQMSNLFSGHLNPSPSETFHTHHHEHSFSEWGNILYNTTIAAAIMDRLVENSEMFLLGGDSLRKVKSTSTSPAE
jgi:IstB-like ATP binding protein